MAKSMILFLLLLQVPPCPILKARYKFSNNKKPKVYDDLVGLRASCHLYSFRPIITAIIGWALDRVHYIVHLVEVCALMFRRLRIDAGHCDPAESHQGALIVIRWLR